MASTIDLTDFLLPNGLTIAETEAATAVTVEEIYIKAFANNVSVPYWSKELGGNNLTILARPDGSEDLASFDAVTDEYHVIKQLSLAGQGKWAYLLKDPRYLSFTQHSAQILHHA